MTFPGVFIQHMTLLIVSVIQWRISLIHSAQKNFSPGGYRKNTFIDIDKFNSVLHFLLVYVHVVLLELNWNHYNIDLQFRQLPQVKKKGFIDNWKYSLLAASNKCTVILKISAYCYALVYNKIWRFEKNCFLTIFLAYFDIAIKQ